MAPGQNAKRSWSNTGSLSAPTTMIPPLVGRQSYARTVASILIVGFVAWSGEWIVHQAQYLLEYRGRFNSVMAQGPHRFYMGPLGIGLLIAALLLGTVLVTWLFLAERQRARLFQRLPRHVRRAMAADAIQIERPAVMRTAGALTLYQIVLYLLQENLEGLTVNGKLPGLWVLVAPQHLSVLPFHVLVAVGGSVLLWLVSNSLRRARSTLHTVRSLLAIFDRRAGHVLQIVPDDPLGLSSRLCTGVHGLRAPPPVLG